jgi:hypothetical protein
MARYTDRRKQEIARRDAQGWSDRFRKDKITDVRAQEPTIPVRIDERTVAHIRVSRLPHKLHLFGHCEKTMQDYVTWWESHKNLHLV